MTDILTFNTSEKVCSKKVPSSSQTRKALQVLQVTASDRNVLVSPQGIMPKNGKVLKPSEESLKISKHNDQDIKGTLPRRSKRKNNNLENQDKVASKEEPSNSKSFKLKVTKASKSKTKATNVKKQKNEQQVLSHQSSLDSYISVDSKPSATTTANVSIESNVFSETKSVTILANEEPGMRTINSASDETDMLTSGKLKIFPGLDVPTEAYWKLMAEQRRKALEVTLYENARLKDELEVLETENGQLKNLLKEAEKIIEIVKASL